MGVNSSKWKDDSFVKISQNGIIYTTLVKYTQQDISPWQHVVLNISDYAGDATVYIQFYFDTYDSGLNEFRGWLVDDVRVYTTVLSQPIQLTSPSHQSTINAGSNQFKWESLEETFGTITYTLHSIARSFDDELGMTDKDEPYVNMPNQYELSKNPRWVEFGLTISF